jgi:hypothetical protein
LVQIGWIFGGIVVEFAHFLPVFGHFLGVQFDSRLIGIGNERLVFQVLGLDFPEIFPGVGDEFGF